MSYELAKITCWYHLSKALVAPKLAHIGSCWALYEMLRRYELDLDGNDENYAGTKKFLLDLMEVNVPDGKILVGRACLRI